MIIPALSPPHVPTTSVMGVDVAAEHARSAKIDGSTEIRVISERYGAVPPRSSLIFIGERSRGVDTLRNDIVLLGFLGAIMTDDMRTFRVEVEIEIRALRDTLGIPADLLIGILAMVISTASL
ncbi:MAG TPA: hypothetical protein VEK37_06175 [Gemmatimonadaceae bacterium]|nr:hypothetical protein [Gemmatimonadaceae bacterium]